MIAAFIISAFFYSEKKGSSDIFLKIGNQSVSSNYYNFLIRKELSEFLSNNPTYDLKDQINSLNLKNIIQDKIESYLVYDHFLKNYLKIRVSKNNVFDFIKNDPNFKDDDGNFSNEKFKEILDQNQITEKLYTEDVRKILRQEYFEKSVLSLEFANKPLNNLIEHFGSAYKEFTLYQIKKPKITQNPTEKELKKFYNNNDYLTDEMRKISYIIIDPRTYKYHNIEVGETEIENDFLKNREYYQEKLMGVDIINIIFKNKEDADSWSEKPLDEKNIDELREQKIAEISEIDDVNLDDIDENIANQIKLLKNDEFTGVIKTNFGFNVIQLKEKNYPENFEEIAKSHIRDSLILERKEMEINELVEKIFEFVEEKKSLNWIAEKLHIDLIITKYFNKDLIDDAENTAEVPNIRGISQIVFSLEEDQKTDLLVTLDDQYSMLEVIDIIKEKKHDFADIEGEVYHDYLIEEINNQQYKIALEIKEKLEKEQKIDEECVNIIENVKFTNHKENIFLGNELNQKIMNQSNIEQTTGPVNGIDGYLYVLKFKKIGYFEKNKLKIDDINEKNRKIWDDKILETAIKYKNPKIKYYKSI